MHDGTDSVTRESEVGQMTLRFEKLGRWYVGVSVTAPLHCWYVLAINYELAH
jgi:hypothetical protein